MLPRTMAVVHRPSRIVAVLRALLPSFVADLVWPEERPVWKVHPTSYLDGLRGIASILVFFCHYTENNHPYLVPTYGLNKDQTSSWLQLPFLRIIYSGRPMVHIFFVISGFVLSYKPIKAIHSQDLDKCYEILSSSTFRRPFRLFGPCIVSTAIIALLMQAGWLGKPLPMYERLVSWSDALFHNITWPWAWDHDLRPPYDVHLWTIPIEFVHSLLLFLVILVFARVRLLIRQTTVVVLMVYCLACGKWAAFEFICGMFLAEVFIRSFPAAKVFEALEGGGVASRCIKNHVLHCTLHTSIIAAALFVGGWPNHDADKTPGISSLLAATPSSFVAKDNTTAQRFWFAISAALMVWSAGELQAMRRFLSQPFAQYCGRISYAVYIVHGPVLDILQRHVIGAIAKPAKGVYGEPDFAPGIPGHGVKGVFGVENAVQRTMSWLVGLMFLIPMVIWVADLFWRYVDAPVVRLAKKIEMACLD